MGTQLDLVVTRFEPRCSNVWLIDLERPDGEPLPSFEAGAHVEVVVGPGLVRPYSLANDPEERFRYQLGVLKDPASRGGSEIICSQWGVGIPVRTSVPRNLFPLDESASHSVLVGGGIGITPLLAMAHRLATLGRSFELHYCSRERAAAPFAELIEQSGLAGYTRFHYSRWRRFSMSEDVGRPSNETSHLYICGPAGFMEQVKDDAISLEWSEAHIHLEQFAAGTDLSGIPFEVRLTDGRCFEIPPGKSIAQCLIEAGYTLEVSCEQGICGTCVVDVIDGEPDHRDHYLTEEERESNGLIALCCSRSRSSFLTLAFS